MRALFGADLEALADAEDIAEFRRHYAALDLERRRILAALIPQLIALQERGDTAAALMLIDGVRRIVTAREISPH
jgi:hypothetical protein